MTPPPLDAQVRAAATDIATLRAGAPNHRALLVGVSGIDGSGKGFVTARLAAALGRLGLSAPVLGIDPWLRPPAERFDPRRPAEHFYERGVRLDEFFERVVMPLRLARSLSIGFDAAGPTNDDACRPARIEIADADVVLVEGIFLFRGPHTQAFDMRIWIDAPFDTALQRAVARAQEGLTPEETTRDFQHIYFPAQRIHLERDDPRALAHLLIDNGTQSPRRPLVGSAG